MSMVGRFPPSEMPGIFAQASALLVTLVGDSKVIQTVTREWENVLLKSQLEKVQKSLTETQARVTALETEVKGTKTLEDRINSLEQLALHLISTRPIRR
jgi:uncharacterized protein YlxW (UPF0749 family)